MNKLSAAYLKISLSIILAVMFLLTDAHALLLTKKYNLTDPSTKYSTQLLKRDIYGSITKTAKSELWIGQPATQTNDYRGLVYLNYGSS